MSKFNKVGEALTFIGGGNSVFTIKSLKTNKHFTYKVSRNKEGNSPYFVRVLAGPDNQSWDASQYIGFLPRYWKSNARAEGKEFLVVGKKGKAMAPSFKALYYVLLNLLHSGDEDSLEDRQFEIMHEGHCCRCNRALTHPDSIKTGIGPECAKHF